MGIGTYKGHSRKIGWGAASWGAFLAVAAAAVATAQGVQTPTSPLPEPSGQGFAQSVVGTATQSSDGYVSEPSGPAAPSAPAPAQSGTAGAEGQGVRVIKGEPRPVTVQGGAGYEAVLSKEVDYPELPDEGLPIDYPGSAQPVTDFLAVLAKASGWNVVASPGLQDVRVQFWISGVKPKQAMEMLRFHGIYYTFDPENKFLYVMSLEEYLSRTYGAVQPEEFSVRYADVMDMEQILTALLSSSGRLVSDARTGQIFVWDTEANLAEMRKVVARLDVPLEARVIPLKYMRAEEVIESVAAMLTERGTVQADPRVNTLVVTDLPARQEEIARIVEALDRKLDTRTWHLSYVDTDTVQERLESIFPEEVATITADEDRRQVSVTGTADIIEQADEVIRSWDIKPRQVRIEAYLVTADVSVTRNFALLSRGATADPFRLPDDGQRFALGRLPYQVPLRNPWTSEPIRDIDGNLVPDPQFRGNHLSVVLDYLNQQGKINILSRPSVTVQDGQEAIFQRIEQLPYQDVGYQGYGTTINTDGGPITPALIPLQVRTVDVGTVLEVTPRITEEGHVQMLIEAEDSTAENVSVVSGDRVSTIPQKRENSASTQVLVHNGQTIVIGGLRTARTNDNEERVPILGEIPGIGRLFKTTRRERQDVDLLLFITPTIVDEYTMPEAERIAEVDAAIAEKLRNSLEPIMKRIENKLSGGKNQINVAIGQDGHIYSDGRMTTIEGLREEFLLYKNPKSVTVYVRRHPRAPLFIADEIAQAAAEVGMETVMDNDSAPFVPTPPPDAGPPPGL